MSPSSNSVPGQVAIRDFAEDDAATIARIHLQAFRGFFLSSLGERFLRKYYLEMSRRPGSIFLVVGEGEPCGFVCGVPEARAFNKSFMKRNFFLVVRSLLGALAKKPKTLSRMLTRSRDNDHFPEAANTISLLSIGVRSGFANMGYGHRLLRDFAERARANGYATVYLTTDRDDNEPVNEFYRKNGFVMIGEYDSGNNRIMNEYSYDCRGK